ncbi:MAG: 4-oxalocrotonate tautomerase [Papillibacter sp.]|jgi:4-oxalocrotonate tautomerase family enzyme|nr:4-oxalocrotonate tautomerase [Papillibacter sp.]
MPHATLKIGLGYPEDKKRSLAEKVAEDISQTLGVEPHWVSVVIEEVPHSRWKQEVWQGDIKDKRKQLYVAPGYDMDKE